MIQILLVDDEPALLDIAKIFIEREEGFAVTTCPSAYDALKKLETGKFNVIICDYEMPAMDGIEFLKKIRESGDHTPFIIFTGRGREQVAIEALNNGADFYLQKGGDPKSQFAELRNMISQAVKRKDAEDAFRRSERQLYEIINFLPDATFAIDREGKIIAWNRAIEDMTGIPAREMLGKGNLEYSLPFYGTRRKILIDLLFEQDEEVIKQYYKQIVRNGHGIIAETEIPMLKQNPTIVWAKATPFYDDDGNVIGAIESIRDITDFKKYEETITNRKNRFLELTEMLPQSVYEIDLEGNILYANQATYDIFGYSRGPEGQRYNIRQMLAPEEHDRGIQGIQNLINGSGTQGDVYTGVRKDGSRFPIQIFASPVVNDGISTGITGIIIDLSEIQAAEDQVRETEELFGSLVGDMPDAVLILDWDGRVLFANTAAAEIIGLPSAGACIGRNVTEVTPQDYREAVFKNLKKVQEGESISLNEYPVNAFSGEVKWIEVLGKRVYYKGQSADLLIARDISPRKYKEDSTRKLAEDRIVYQKFLLDLSKIDLTEFSVAVSRMLEIDANVMGLERVSYWKFEKDRTSILCEDLYRKSTGMHTSGDRLEAGMNPVYFSALENSRLIVADDAENDIITREMKTDYLLPLGITSMLDVPVWYDGIVVGIVCHEHTGTRRTWTESEKEFATSVAEHISLAIETSKRHEIERELRDSEAMTRVLIDAPHEVAMLLSRDGTVLNVNSFAAEMMGLKTGEMAGKNIYGLLEEEIARKRREWLERATETGKIAQWQDENHGRIFENTVYPIRDSEGTVNRLGIFGRDITDQKRSAGLLEERERFLNNIFSSIRDGISILDNSMTIMRVNPVMETWYAHMMPLVGKKCYEAYHVRNERCEPCPSHATLTTGISSYETVPKGGPGGTVVGWLELYSYPLIDNTTGMMTGVIEYVRDITSRREAEDALRESEERLKIAIDGGDIGTWEFDSASPGILIVNEKWTGILGYRAGKLELSMNDWQRSFHPEVVSQSMDTIRNLFEGKTRSVDMETRMWSMDGYWKWLLVRGKIISYDSAGKPKKIAGTIQDISEMRKYREIVEIINRKLVLLNSITRHDLQNQLTVLNGALELAKLESSGEGAVYLRMAEEAAGAMTRQIAFTKEYQDIGVHKPVWQDVALVAGHARDSLLSDKVAIDIHVGTIRIFADPLLEKVFYNLFDNALRHGGPPLTTIQVLAREEENSMTIIVEDDGVGIIRKDKEKIFERGIGENTGLGLFLVREILSITGISLQETGLPGKGARFEIHVPKGSYVSDSCAIPPDE